jgi:hypothetical protein
MSRYMLILLVSVALTAGSACQRQPATGEPAPDGPMTPAERPESTASAGSATAQLQGAISRVVFFDQLSASPRSIYEAGNPVAALYFTNSEGDQFQYGGPSAEGSYRTGEANSTISINVAGSLFHTSADECVVTITHSDGSRIAGEYRCQGLADQEGNILDSASGNFEAETDRLDWNGASGAATIEI